MIQTVVSNASAPEYGQATISFPIREEDYGRYLLAQQGYQQHAASGSFIRRNQLDFCYERSQPPTQQAHFEMKL